MFISSTCYTIKKLSLTIISERAIIWLIYYYTIFALLHYLDYLSYLGYLDYSWDSNIVSRSLMCHRCPSAHSYQPAPIQENP